MEKRENFAVSEKPLTDSDYKEFEVWEMFFCEYEDGDADEFEWQVDKIKALSIAHAELILKNGINSKKYQEGAWLECSVNGKKYTVENLSDGCSKDNFICIENRKLFEQVVPSTTLRCPAYYQACERIREGQLDGSIKWDDKLPLSYCYGATGGSK